MKPFAVTAILLALYFLYRIAFPKQNEVKKGDNIPQKNEVETDEIVGQSRFVRINRSHLQPTSAVVLETENQTEKAHIFANADEKMEALIPPEELDKVFERFSETTDIEETFDEEEESEELRQTIGEHSEPAQGFTYEEISMAAAAAKNLSETQIQQALTILSGIEKTDMFEQMISGDEGKALKIKTIIDRHIQDAFPEKIKEENNEAEDFNIADFLS